MKTFYRLLGNSLIIVITNFFIWSTLTYWSYLSTKSVLATSILSGAYLVAVTLSGFWFGSIVDHNKKKTAMIISGFGTLLFFIFGLLVYLTAPAGSFASVASFRFWLFAVILLAGVIVGNIRSIAVPTVITFLVPEELRAKANGLSGTVMGIAFAVSSVASGFALATVGMVWALVIAIVLAILAMLHLVFFIPIEEKEIVHLDGKPKKLDIKGTIAVMKGIPGLFGLIFFTTFNNFLGGVFMPLMDAYGLSLVRLEVWGLLWGGLSSGFILGGLMIAKKGLGKNPVSTLFRINIVLWFVCMFMAVQPSIVLLAIGMFIYLCLIPFVEASEQTIIQKVVPVERQGRVFGFAQSVETSAAPLTAFIIGPIAQYGFIPFMTTGKGAELIGSWFGTGPGRGIALVFTFAGVLGLIVTLIAIRSRAYNMLSKKYLEPVPVPVAAES